MIKQTIRLLFKAYLPLTKCRQENVTWSSQHRDISLFITLNSETKKIQKLFTQIKIVIQPDILRKLYRKQQRRTLQKQTKKLMISSLICDAYTQQMSKCNFAEMHMAFFQSIDLGFYHLLFQILFLSKQYVFDSQDRNQIITSIMQKTNKQSSNAGNKQIWPAFVRFFTQICFCCVSDQSKDESKHQYEYDPQKQNRSVIIENDYQRNRQISKQGTVGQGTNIIYQRNPAQPNNNIRDQQIKQMGQHNTIEQQIITSSAKHSSQVQNNYKRQQRQVPRVKVQSEQGNIKMVAQNKYSYVKQQVPRMKVQSEYRNIKMVPNIQREDYLNNAQTLNLNKNKQIISHNYSAPKQYQLSAKAEINKQTKIKQIDQHMQEFNMQLSRASSFQSLPSTGLPNIGNICFFSAILQNLFAIVDFRQKIIKIGSSQQNKTTKKKIFALKIAKLFKLLKQKDLQSNNAYLGVTSLGKEKKIALMELVQHLKIIEAGYKFNSQNDSLFYLTNILFQLKKQCPADNLERFLQVEYIDYGCPCSPDQNRIIETYVTNTENICQNGHVRPQYQIIRASKYLLVVRCQIPLEMKFQFVTKQNGKYQKIVYKMISNTVYRGNGTSGHYIGRRKNKSNKWKQYNDNTVTIIKSDQILQKKNYSYQRIIYAFYQREEQTCDLSLQDKRKFIEKTQYLDLLRINKQLGQRSYSKLKINQTLNEKKIYKILINALFKISGKKNQTELREIYFRLDEKKNRKYVQIMNHQNFFYLSEDKIQIKYPEQVEIFGKILSGKVLIFIEQHLMEKAVEVYQNMEPRKFRVQQNKAKFKQPQAPYKLEAYSLHFDQKTVQQAQIQNSKEMNNLLNKSNAYQNFKHRN